MELINFSISLILIICSLGLIWFFFKNAFRSLRVLKEKVFKPAPSSKGPKKIKPLSKTYSNNLDDVEKLLENNQNLEALKKIKKTFLLEKKPSENYPLISLHNRKTLSSLLKISDLQNSKISNLSILEQLFNEIEEFEEEYIKTEKSFKNIRSKRSKSGKAVPNWGKNEFKEKLKEVKNNRINTLNCLIKQLEKAYDELKEGAKNNKNGVKEEEERTYH